MKWLQNSLSLACLLCLSLIVPAIQAQSDATIQIQVLQSRLSPQANGMKGLAGVDDMLQIEAVIQGQTYWLQAGIAKNGLLKPGEYPGKLVKDNGKPPYKINQEWELTYPDGKHEKFKLVAIVGK